MKKPKIKKGDWMRLIFSDGRVVIEVVGDNNRRQIKIPDFLSGLIIQFVEDMQEKAVKNKQLEIRKTLGL